MAFKISVTSNLKTDAILGKIDNPALITAIANAAKNIMNDYVPFDTGVLAGSAYAENGFVVYPVLHAIYPYHRNVNFRKDHHPKATSEWDKHSIGQGCSGPEGGRFVDEAAKIIKKGLG